MRIVLNCLKIIEEKTKQNAQSKKICFMDGPINHPFIDGNKRVAFLSLGLSLRLNEYRLTASQPEATQTILMLAAGDLSEKALATWVREQITRI